MAGGAPRRPGGDQEVSSGPWMEAPAPIKHNPGPEAPRKQLMSPKQGPRRGVCPREGQPFPLPCLTAGGSAPPPPPLEGLGAPAPSGDCRSHPSPCSRARDTQSSDGKKAWGGAGFRECWGPRPPLSRPHLTLLAPCTAVEQGVQQQLEGGRGPQVVEQLQDVGLGQESFAPIEGL